MTVLDRVKAHYGRNAAGDGRASIAVPEWGEERPGGTIEPLAIYWQPLTLADLRQSRRGGQEADFAELVALKAEDRNGDKLFDLMEAPPVLRNKADALVVTRIGLAMLGSIPTVKDQEKN